jgi:hypothetical protein
MMHRPRSSDHGVAGDAGNELTVVHPKPASPASSEGIYSLAPVKFRPEFSFRRRAAYPCRRTDLRALPDQQQAPAIGASGPSVCPDPVAFSSLMHCRKDNASWCMWRQIDSLSDITMGTRGKTAWFMASARFPGRESVVRQADFEAEAGS